MRAKLGYYQIFWNKQMTNTFEYRYDFEMKALIKCKIINSYCLIENIKNDFNKRFGKLYTKEQLENIKKLGNNWKPYPRNEEIKQFIQGIRDKQIDDIKRIVCDKLDELMKNPGEEDQIALDALEDVLEELNK